ncbi:MAG: staygreen family protein [Candidatus Bathyarchaeota archaeon]|nr:staygreen family protein [Candidatus Bathyarchaeota archaeon]
MRRLSPEKLHVTYLPGIRSEGPVVSRRYTITHSDIIGDIFLTIGPNYNLKQISGWYIRFMRD